MKAEEEIRELLREINRAWVEGHPERLAGFFHPDMVIVSPDFKQRAEGRGACVKSYEDFCRQATIQEFQETEFTIDVFGRAAVASYRFEIRYEMNSQSLRDTGRDIFIFVREGTEWRAAWRTMILPLQGPPEHHDP